MRYDLSDTRLVSCCHFTVDTSHTRAHIINAMNAQKCWKCVVGGFPGLKIADVYLCTVARWLVLVSEEWDGSPSLVSRYSRVWKQDAAPSHNTSTCPGRWTILDNRPSMGLFQGTFQQTFERNLLRIKTHDVSLVVRIAWWVELRLRVWYPFHINYHCVVLGGWQ